jgi:hypothetical protein
MNLEAILRAMPADLEIVVIGGNAAHQYLPTYVTNDGDGCFDPDPVNWQRVMTWLQLFAPEGWIAQQRRPLVWDATTPIRDDMVLTQEGEVDLVQHVDGIGAYPQVKAMSVAVPIFGKTLHFLTLPGLIVSKRAANRPKDRLLLQHLEDFQRRNP